jgi:hypothetical protein
MTTRILGIVVAAACSVGGTAEATTNLKPFDPVALQGVVEATAKELLLPGAMVLLRTPQREGSSQRSKPDRSTDIAGVRLVQKRTSRVPKHGRPGYTSCDGGMIRQSFW